MTIKDFSVDDPYSGSLRHRDYKLLDEMRDYADLSRVNMKILWATFFVPGDHHPHPDMSFMLILMTQFESLSRRQFPEVRDRFTPTAPASFTFRI